MTPRLTDRERNQLAFEGAVLTHQKLLHQVRVLERTFPGLANGHAPIKRRLVVKRSAKSLKAQSEKMRKIWAAKKKEAAAKG